MYNETSKYWDNLTHVFDNIPQSSSEVSHTHYNPATLSEDETKQSNNYLFKYI